MDGTLVDSMIYWDTVVAEFLQANGICDEGLLDKLKPMTLPQSAVYLREKYGSQYSVTDMFSQMCALMHEHYLHDVQVKPGVLQFLDKLRARGVRMCVASTSPDDLVQTCLNAHNLCPYFEFVLSAEKIGKGKTEPDIFLLCAEKLGGTPADTVVFEDALTAGETAKKAGFAVAGVYDETGKAEWEPLKAIADYVVTDWNELE